MPTTAASRILEGYRPALRRRRSSSGSKPPARSSSARPTATSSRWDRRPRTPPTASTRNPWNLRADSRRLERRIGGRGGRPAGAARARFGHRRLDPAAGGALRRDRPQADLRPRLALRPARVRVVARSDRSDRDDGRGRGAGVQRHRRTRPARRDLGRTRRCRISAGAVERRLAERRARRRAARADGGGRRAGRARRRSIRRSRSSPSAARRSSTSTCHTAGTASPRTT